MQENQFSNEGGISVRLKGKRVNPVNPVTDFYEVELPRSTPPNMPGLNFEEYLNEVALQTLQLKNSEEKQKVFG